MLEKGHPMKKSTKIFRNLIIFALLISACLLPSCSAGDAGYAPEDATLNYSSNNKGDALFPGEVNEGKFEVGDAVMNPSYEMEIPEQVIPPQQIPDKFVENDFISVATQPISTFSSDVDTASYTYFRKLVNSGYGFEEIKRNFGTSLRTEEMLNYFSYDYKGPAEGELFGVNAEIAPCPWNSEAVLFRLGLKSEATIKTKGNNLVFLIDVSGSMNSQDKLPLLKTAFSYLTAQLTENDTISIVTYSGKESVVLTGCNGSKSETILKAITNLTSGGSTNGQAGLKTAYSIASDYFIEGGNNRIIMASDGDLNVGISSPEELKAYVESERDRGIYLSVLGFGTGNYRDSNMEALADNGNGVYYYIDGAEEAEKIFGTELLSTLYTVAEDVKLQLTFDPTAVSEYRLVGYENRLLATEDFEDDLKDAGEVGAGHSLTVCYELKLTDSALETENWLKLAVRHKEPSEKQSKLSEYNIGTAAYTTAPSEDFRFACGVIQVSMLLHDSEYLSGKTLPDIYEYLRAIPMRGGDTLGLKPKFVEMIGSLVK